MRHGGRTSWSALIIAGMYMAMTPRPALAGMPTVTLTDVARLRVHTISFFLLLLLLSAWAIQRIWNSLRRDFVRLPQLTYRRSLGLVAIWGLLFLLVLTMISGARELMTPGAWVRQGAISHVADSPHVLTEADRRAQVLVLKMGLWDYAKAHDSNLPPDLWTAGLAPAVWETPDVTRAPYVYIPGRRAGADSLPVAYEPRFFDPPRLVLFSDGQIRAMSETELATAVKPGKTP